MALQRSKEIPEGAIFLTEDEALKHQWKNVSLLSKRERWPFTYGVGLLATCVGFSSMYINNHFRIKFKLMDFGRLATYFPNTVIPVVFFGAFHHLFITNDVLIGKTECSICVEMRALAIQVGFGVLFPSVLVPLSTSLATKYYGSYRLPEVHKEPMEAVRLFGKLYRPIKKTLVNLAIAHAVAATFVTYLEVRSVWKMRENLLRLKAEEDKESNDDFVI